MKIHRNSISLAGEFAVLSQLALKGYDANMTLGNTKSVDILVSNPKNGKMYKLEVKTSFGIRSNYEKMFGKNISWIMSRKHEKIVENNLFYTFVSIDANNSNRFRFFIIPSALVANYVKDQHKYWLNKSLHINRKLDKEIDMRTFRVGLEDIKHSIKTPLASKYEDNWEFNL